MRIKPYVEELTKQLKIHQLAQALETGQKQLSTSVGASRLKLSRRGFSANISDLLGRDDNDDDQNEEFTSFREITVVKEFYRREVIGWENNWRKR